MVWPPAPLMEFFVKRITLFLGLLMLALVVVYMVSNNHLTSQALGVSQADQSSGSLSVEAPSANTSSLENSYPSDRPPSVAIASARELESPAVVSSSLSERVQDLESSARTDPNAFLALESLRSLCHSW